MMRKLGFTAFLLMALAGWSGAEQPAEGFFEFSAGERLAPVLVSAMDASPESARVFQGLEKVILAGGADQDVSRMTVVNGELVSEPLPELPFELSRAGAAVVGDRLYLAGGQSGAESNTAVLRLDLLRKNSEWVICSTVPAGIGEQPVLIALHGILTIAGFGAGGADAYSYNPARDEWTALASAPEDLRGSVGVSCGDAHLLFFNSSDPDDRILAYHRITDTWFAMGHLPQAVAALGAVSSGAEFSVLSRGAVFSGEALLRPTKYGVWDHLVVAVLVCALVGVGLYFSKKEKSSGDYFRGGNRIPWWAAGLSLFATGASAISLMAMPGKSFAENWIYFSGAIFVVLIQLPLMVWVYIPVARRLEISTANEYLERRFSLPVRMLGFVCFSLNQLLGRMAAILLLPALAISAIFGLPMEYSILIMGVVTTLFVTLGGLEAVIWTDVLQAVIMLAAVVVCSVYAFVRLEISIPAATEILANLDKLRMFDFSFDWKAPVFLVILLNTAATVLGLIGDQNFIQRVQCTRDEKESRKAIYTQLAVAVPMNLVLFALGTLMFLFYVTRADSISPALKADGVFPFFAAQNLPPGLAGFVVVALLAATISTVSSAMNSVANLGVEDVYRRFFPKATDHKCLVFGRILTFGLGIFGTVAALLLARTSGLQSIWDLFLMITGMVLAPITGIFVLGIFSRRVNTLGVWAGTAASVFANYYAKFYMDLHAMIYLIVGVFSCIGVGYLASFLAPRPVDEKVNGLTIYTLRKTEEG